MNGLFNIIGLVLVALLIAAYIMGPANLGDQLHMFYTHLIGAK